MREQILELIAEMLKIDISELEAAKDSRDIWDSLVRVEILFALEDEYGIQFSEEELPKLETPAALCDATIMKLEQE